MRLAEPAPVDPTYPRLGARLSAYAPRPEHRPCPACTESCAQGVVTPKRGYSFSKRCVTCNGNGTVWVEQIECAA